ncbi:MAG: hypothetical protein ACR2JE_12910 [Acidobacteriaceae bacterium]
MPLALPLVLGLRLSWPVAQALERRARAVVFEYPAAQALERRVQAQVFAYPAAG